MLSITLRKHPIHLLPCPKWHIDVTTVLPFVSTLYIWNGDQPIIRPYSRHNTVLFSCTTIWTVQPPGRLLHSRRSKKQNCSIDPSIAMKFLPSNASSAPTFTEAFSVCWGPPLLSPRPRIRLWLRICARTCYFSVEERITCSCWSSYAHESGCNPTLDHVIRLNNVDVQVSLFFFGCI